MARTNVPFIALGNRGLVSPKALARVDLDRTRMSAEVYTNWLPKTQGALTIRPGTKYCGSSVNDTGATWIEFVAATDDTALIELTHQKMRVWVEDTGTAQTPVQRGALVPIARPKVDTTLTITDTGWSNASTGGALSIGSTTDVIPTMTGSTTSGVTISASSEDADQSRQAWRAADDNTGTEWWDTGPGGNTIPSWWKVDFGTDTGNRQAVKSYSIRAHGGAFPQNAPERWALIRSNWDTGTWATDTGKWTQEDTQGSETGWAVGERRTYTLPAADTGTIEPYRYWKFTFDAIDAGSELLIAEIEMFTAASALQVRNQGGKKYLNATSIGALARTRKQVAISDTGTEHSLAIYVERGPVTLRVGSTSGDDDYINETELGTGYHNLAFTPTVNFHVTLQSDALVDRIVGSMAIGDSGSLEVTTFVDANELSDIRYDQSADVVYCNCADVEPHKIERRGTGRSWSFVEYQPDNGPFLPSASSSAKLSVSQKYGNTKMNSDVPFFRSGHSGHVGALVRLFNSGQSGLWPLGALNAATDAIKVTGISDTGDTGTPSQGSERRITISVTGTYTGTIQLERSFEGEESGFHPVSTSGGYIPDDSGGSADTGTFTRVINDPDDNVTAYYRAKMSAYTSGVALVQMTYPHGGVNGIARITAFNSNTDVDIEVLSRFSDTGPTDVWQEGAFSTVQRFPSAVALHGGRLSHAADANLYMSVADDYENFDDETVGDAAPIVRTLGSGPVDNIYYLVSLLRLIIGTSGAEIELRSSSLDEPVTRENSSARQFSTQGSANLRALKMDTSAIFAQRSGQRVFMIGQSADEFGGYQSTELTMLVPDLLSAGIVDIAIQRQPDTRVHCVLANGKVAILTYEPQEEVMCWSMWETDGTVEKAMVLPGTGEDQVYYHINRTINGATKRYLEKWATEAECEGDTGLSWLADCAAQFFDTGGTDTGRSSFLHAVVPHLPLESVTVWGDDTGNTYPSKDYSLDDTGGDPTLYTADTGGDVTLTGTNSVRNAVVGLPYVADWKSTKLAYAAEAGTALAQMKRTDKIAFVLYRTHNNGLFFGSDTGNLDPLPRMIKGAQVDAREIFQSFDQAAMAFPGLWDTDSRIHLRAKSPRPCTVLAAIPTVSTNEKV